MSAVAAGSWGPAATSAVAVGSGAAAPAAPAALVAAGSAMLPGPSASASSTCDAVGRDSGSRAVIAVSEWTRRDIEAHYGPRIAARTSVSGEGSGDAFRPRPREEVDAARSRHGLVRDYLVYVGNAKPHKNLDVLVQAHRASGVEADLVLVTGDLDAARFAGDGVVVARGVDDDELAALYSGARAFTTASLDEGYCLPVAEALACGCPVIASTCGAIPETAAGHARLVPPTLAAWTSALAEPVARREPVLVGDWAAAARRTVEAFDRALR